MKITDFHPSHLGALRPRYSAERELLANITREFAAALAAEPSVTLWMNGRPIACGGVLGNCELWAVCDESCCRYKFTLFKAAKEFLARFGWLYARVDSVYGQGQRLLEHLGFKATGPLQIAGVWRQQYERAI